MCGITLSPSGIMLNAPTWRGPDETKIKKLVVAGITYTLQFCRLRVVDGPNAEQPFIYNLWNDATSLVQVTNGEIYNHAELRVTLQTAVSNTTMATFRECMLHGGLSELDASAALQAHLLQVLQLDNVDDASDCNIIAKMVPIFGLQRTFERLHGVFACVLKYMDRLVLARDRYGVRPLYYGHDVVTGQLVVMSSLNCIDNASRIPDLRQFPPGHYLVFDPRTQHEELVRFTPELPPRYLNEQVPLRQRVARGFYEACRVRCQQQDFVDHINTYVLLSGGMDSSVVLAAAAYFLRPQELTAVTGYYAPAAIDAKETADVVNARELCAELGIKDHRIVAFKSYNLSRLQRVIRVLGTWDTTTIRASTAQLAILDKVPRVRAIGCSLGRVILGGEGADEMGQGYQNFKRAPSPEAADVESKRLMDHIHHYDGLRADRTTAKHGWELRLPFMDVRFIQLFHMLPAQERFDATIEKRALRDLMANEVAELIPTLKGPVMQRILRRPKEALSDSVGAGHIAALKQLAEDTISDAVLANAAQMWPHCPPQTKEECLYRRLFNEECPGVSDHHVPERWMFRFIDGNPTDPSATLLPCYQSGNTK